MYYIIYYFSYYITYTYVLSSNPPLHHVRIFSKRVGRFSLAWPVVAANPRYKKSFIAWFIWFLVCESFDIETTVNKLSFYTQCPTLHPAISSSNSAWRNEGGPPRRKNYALEDASESHPSAITGIITMYVM